MAGDVDHDDRHLVASDDVDGVAVAGDDACRRNELRRHRPAGRQVVRRRLELRPDDISTAAFCARPSRVRVAKSSSSSRPAAERRDVVGERDDFLAPRGVG